MKEEQPEPIELNNWIDKLTRRQKRIIFKQDKFSNRVKQLLK